MTVEMIDGIRVLKLHDHAPSVGAATDDMLTMVHLWRLLSGTHALRDNTVGARTML